eukprot:14087588-Alexandrium_andersonii.AAC.1
MPRRGPWATAASLRAVGCYGCRATGLLRRAGLRPLLSAVSGCFLLLADGACRVAASVDRVCCSRSPGLR